MVGAKGCGAAPGGEQRDMVKSLYARDAAAIAGIEQLRFFLSPWSAERVRT